MIKRRLNRSFALPHSLFENSTNLAPPTFVRLGVRVALRVSSRDIWTVFRGPPRRVQKSKTRHAQTVSGHKRRQEPKR